MMQTNPFIFGDPVRGDDFLNRRQELRRLVGRVRSGGSAVITAEPRMGKTSLLLYLQDNANELPGKETGRTIFRFLDGHNMSGWDATRFWQEALEPLLTLPPIRAIYNPEKFDPDMGEAIFRKLEEEGHRFVLLLDEFDTIQGEAGLHQRSVYGWLRSLSSRYQSFSLVVAARRTITELNHQSREFAAGSPFFNNVQIILPAPFPEKYVGDLLARAGERFTADDRRFLRRMGGQHPYFLQTAAYYLWDWYEEEDDPAVRYQKAGQDFYQSASEAVLSDIWHSWTPYMQMAFTLSALESMPALLSLVII